MSAKYFTRPRMEENTRKWRGPFDVSQLRDEARRKQFSKDLHEISEDRLNWRPAKEIWSLVFPKNAATVTASPVASPVATPEAVPTEPMPETSVYSLSQQGQDGWNQQNTAEVSEAQAPTSEVESFDWHCVLDGEQQGPFALSQLRSLIARDQLQPDDLVWCPSFGEQWVQAQSVRDLAKAWLSADFPDGDPDLFDQDAATPPMALASFVLSLLGASLLLGLGSILAVVFGHMALAEFHQNRSLTKGRGLAIAGVVIGYTTIGLLVIAGVIYLALKSGSGEG